VIKYNLKKNKTLLTFLLFILYIAYMKYKTGQTLNVYYHGRIHKGKVAWIKSGKAGLVLTDPFNWRFGKTFVTIPL